MTKPRCEQVSLSDTPWYHLVNRCVRRAFLCGQDKVTGRCYEHRRIWLETLMLQLASVFAVDVAAYAIMSNHYHLVLRVNHKQAQAWTNQEVLQRWTKLFTGPELVQRYLTEPVVFSAPIEARVMEYAEEYRQRLQDVSWLMRLLNEPVARMANKEEGVKGRFWEGRFKSQALLDKQAIIAVMAYVDLNPVRAGIAEDLPSSDFTSIQRRITGNTAPIQIKEQQHLFQNSLLTELPLAELMPFDPGGQQDNCIPFSLTDYLELADYLGRSIHPTKKRGVIASDTPELMTQLGLTHQWVKDMGEGRWLNGFGWAIGTAQNLQKARPHRMKGAGKAKEYKASAGQGFKGQGFQKASTQGLLKF